MTESNAKILKVVLSLLAVVSIVLIIVFAAGVGKDTTAPDDDYESMYVEDGEDMMGDQNIDDIYWDDSSISDSDYISSGDALYEGDY